MTFDQSSLLIAALLDSIKPLQDADAILQTMASLNKYIPATPAELVMYKLQAIERILGVAYVAVYELINNELRIAQFHAPETRKFQAGIAIADTDSLWQSVKDTAQIVVIPDIANDVRTAERLGISAPPAAAAIGMPLHTSDGSVHGMLTIIDVCPRTFSAAQIAIVQIVAGEIAYIFEREAMFQYMSQAMNDATVDLGATLGVLGQQQTVLRIVAHDLRTPLSAIFTGSSALLQGMFGPIDPSKQRVVDLMDKASRYMDRLINDLMDASLAEGPMMMLILEKFDLYTVGSELIALCQPRAQEAGLTLRLETDGNELVITSDRARLMQALLNLISNAITYTLQGSVTLRIASSSDHVLFEVIDTGPGIAPENLERIWEPHVRVTRKSRGLGLGLYVVSLLARKMGGETGVRSTVDAGSTFWLRLPHTITVS